MHLQASDAPKPASTLTLALLLALPACASAARITVDTTSVADLDDAACSLYEAIVAANSDAAYHGCDAGAGADEIDFDLPPASVIGGTLFALPTLTTSMTFIGPGAEDLTIDGAGLQPLFLIDSPSGGELVEFRDLTLARGNAFVFSFNRGGAITVVDGDRASMRRMVFRANHSELAGGAVLVTTAPGSNRATALVEDCHFEANEADLAGGGAVYAQRSRLDISRSTFAFNSTEAEPAMPSPGVAAPCMRAIRS